MHDKHHQHNMILRYMTICYQHYFIPLNKENTKWDKDIFFHSALTVSRLATHNRSLEHISTQKSLQRERVLISNCFIDFAIKLCWIANIYNANKTKCGDLEPDHIHSTEKKIICSCLFSNCFKQNNVLIFYVKLNLLRATKSCDVDVMKAKNTSVRQIGKHLRDQESDGHFALLY